MSQRSVDKRLYVRPSRNASGINDRIWKQHFRQTNCWHTKIMCQYSTKSPISFYFQGQTVEIPLYNFFQLAKRRSVILKCVCITSQDVRLSNFIKSQMSLIFICDVNRLEFRCFACNFQTVGPRIIHFGMHVDDATSLLKFERITNVLLLHLLRSSFQNVFVIFNLGVGWCRAKYFCLIIVSNKGSHRHLMHTP